MVYPDSIIWILLYEKSIYDLISYDLLIIRIFPYEQFLCDLIL